MNLSTRPIRVFMYPEEKAVTGVKERFFLIGEEGKVHAMYTCFSPFRAWMHFNGSAHVRKILNHAYRHYKICRISDEADMTENKLRSRTPNILKVTTTPLPVR